MHALEGENLMNKTKIALLGALLGMPKDLRSVQHREENVP